MSSKEFLFNLFTKKSKKNKKMDSVMKEEQVVKPASPEQSQAPEGTPSPDSCHEVMGDEDVTTPLKIEFESIEEQQEEQPYFQVTSPARPQLQEQGPRNSSSSSGAGIAVAYGGCQEDEAEEEPEEEEEYEEEVDFGDEEEKPRYYEFYHNQPSALGVRCKSLENFSDDYKLQVLQWAYSKTVHSAGHHFRLERFIVRNWMMNEEKIVKGASERVIRKFERYDERVFEHLTGDRPSSSLHTESPVLHGADDIDFRRSLPQ